MLPYYGISEGSITSPLSRILNISAKPRILETSRYAKSLGLWCALRGCRFRVQGRTPSEDSGQSLPVLF